MTIPASSIVAVTPGVLSAGGSALVLNGLVLTRSTRVPIGTVASFSSDTAVGAFFGDGSHEAAVAEVYFEGPDNSLVKPGAILFAQYNDSAVAAYLRGGNISALTLAQLQAISGSLDVIIDGYARNAASVNLSSATSFSSAATIIATALNAANPTEATVTASIGATFTGSQSGTNLTTTSTAGLISVGDTIAGTGVANGTKIMSQTSGSPGGNGVYVTSLSGTASTASCTASSNVLDVTVASGSAIAIGQTVVGAGVTSEPITALGTGTGGTGTYVISGAPQQVASESMTTTGTPVAVTYDSVLGAFSITSGITGAPSTAAFATGTIAATLLLTSATGAVLSQGASVTTPAAFMTALTRITQNWASFMTAFDPDNGSGNVNKLAFAAWTSTQNNRYAYVAWDTDASPTVTVPATGSLGYLIAQADYSGTLLQWEPSDLLQAAFALSYPASLDFTALNGRTTFAFLSQSGLVGGVTDQTVASNLIANGYNFYGAYATANDQFVFEYPGSVSGPFKWFDSYVNQIWLNNSFQLALLTFLKNARSVPFNISGDTAITTALLDPINAGLNFGAIRKGVALSASQVSAINSAAGNQGAANAVQNQGWYIKIGVASSEVRQARGPRQVLVFYSDGESVQTINLSSTDVQ